MTASRPSGRPAPRAGPPASRPVRPRRASGSRAAARNSEIGAKLGGFGADSPRTVPCSEFRDAGIPPLRPAPRAGPPASRPVRSRRASGSCAAARNSEIGAKLGGFGADSPGTVPCSEFRDAGIPPARPARSRGAPGLPSLRPTRPLARSHRHPAPFARLGARTQRGTRRMARSSEDSAWIFRDRRRSPRFIPGGRPDTLPAYARDPARRTPSHPPCLRPTPGPADAEDTCPAASRIRSVRDARVASRTCTRADCCRGDASGERIMRFH